MAKSGSRLYGLANNPPSFDDEVFGHIRRDPNDAFVERIKELIGENRSSFARKSGVMESTLRKYEAGSKPNSDNLAAIARAGGLTVDWLATGRPPRSRSDIPTNTTDQSNVSQRQHDEDIPEGRPQVQRCIDQVILRQCLAACIEVHGNEFAGASPSIQMDYAIELYNQLARMAEAHAGKLNEYQKLGVSALADQLRLFLQMGWAKAYPPT